MFGNTLLLISSWGAPIGKPIIKSASVYCYNEQLDIQASSFAETGEPRLKQRFALTLGNNNVLYQWTSENNSASFLISLFPEARKIQFVGKWLFIRHLGPGGTASEWSDGVNVVQQEITTWCEV